MPLDRQDSIRSQQNDAESTADPKGLSTVDVDGTEQTIVAGEGSGNRSASSLTITEGDRLGKYEIRRLLGKGAMGSVFLAFDPMIRREVAIKVLPVDFADQPMVLDRFLTEARATGRLSHRNVVSIHEIDEQEGQFYIVMEVLDGGSLAAVTDDGQSVPWQEACRLVAEAADGLAAAHAAGLVHRDIKPENLMITGDGIVKVVDFGLSKLIDAANDTRDAATKDGTILGTPQYMSPEQCETAAVDLRSDVYSLGGTLFRLLTGRHPYEEIPTLLQVMMAHASKPVPDPLMHNSELPEGCRKIVARAMAKSPSDRYQDAAQMAADLRALVDSHGGLAAPGGTSQDSRDYRSLESAVIIEPSKMQSLMLTNALKTAGVRSVSVSASKSDARSLLASQAVDMLITAMQLPDGSGAELLVEQRVSDSGQKMMLVLNSSDTSIDELIQPGESGPLALVAKRTKPDEIWRAIHACSFLNLDDVPFRGEIDPLASRILVICDSPQIPEAIAEQIRRMNLLDLVVTTFEALAAGDGPTEAANLVLATRTAGNAENDTLVYTRLIDRIKLQADAIAAVQIDGERSVLRAVRREGFVALARCPFDDVRLTRLIQIVQN